MRSWWHWEPRSAGGRIIASATATRTSRIWAAPMSERGAVVFRDRTDTQVITGFLRQGSGPAVVFVHGVGLQASVWEEQISTLSKHYDVIAIDMLGHGGSSLPPSDARLSDYSDQL